MQKKLCPNRPDKVGLPTRAEEVARRVGEEGRARERRVYHLACGKTAPAPP